MVAIVGKRKCQLLVFMQNRWEKSSRGNTLYVSALPHWWHHFLCGNPLLKKTTTHLGQLCESTGEFSRSVQGTPKLTIKKLRPVRFTRLAQFITRKLYSLMVLLI